MSYPYGICPTCGEPGVSMAKNPVGPTICSNGHRHDHVLFHPPVTKLSSKDAFIKVMTESKRDVNQLSEGAFANPTTNDSWRIWQLGVTFGKEQ